jgi:heme exporter protein A
MKLVAHMLSSIRGGRSLFTDLSFAVDAGQSLLVTGPNGAGKTTLIRILAGLLRPTGGELRLEGMSEGSLGERCHYVGHLDAVKTTLTVRENAAFWCGFLGGSEERIEAALDSFGLADLQDIPAGYLSAGQKRRLGMARVLLADRPLWLLDEPTAVLDHAAQDALARKVNAHLAAGGLTVAATHLPLGFINRSELYLGRVPRGA